MKQILLLLFFVPVFVFAQQGPLIVHGASPELYLNHTVAPKENYYSIGRLYNISPKEIAPFNNLTMEAGLSLGQVIKIPLTSNFVQGQKPAADEVLVPVYHTVQDKEGLYRISTTHNKVPLETLKKWNNISGESVSAGTPLIVGYLKVKKDLSAFANGATAPPAPVATNMPKEEKKPVVKEQPAPAPPPVAKVEEKPVVKAEPAKKDPPKTEPVVTYTSAKNFNGGAFKADYEKQSKKNDVATESGTGAVFKSTSGWEDGKYYCFHNSALSGTIVKITNNTTGKSVYARVLDLMPDIKQNQGLVLRVSNAAADELGAGEGKFDCSISYVK